MKPLRRTKSAAVGPVGVDIYAITLTLSNLFSVYRSGDVEEAERRKRRQPKHLDLQTHLEWNQ